MRRQESTIAATSAARMVKWDSSILLLGQLIQIFLLLLFFYNFLIFYFLNYDFTILKLIHFKISNYLLICFPKLFLYFVWSNPAFNTDCFFLFFGAIFLFYLGTVRLLDFFFLLLLLSTHFPLPHTCIPAFTYIHATTQAYTHTFTYIYMHA